MYVIIYYVYASVSALEQGSVCGSQKRARDPRKSECALLTEVLETELRSSERAASALLKAASFLALLSLAHLENEDFPLPHSIFV